MILAPLQKLTNNVGNLFKIIVATGFELLPKVQKIAQSGHTGYGLPIKGFKSLWVSRDPHSVYVLHLSLSVDRYVDIQINID